jgi:hypothetical protein
MGKAKPKVFKVRTEPIVIPFGEGERDLVEAVRNYGAPLLVAEFEAEDIAEVLQAFIETVREVEGLTGITLRLEEGTSIECPTCGQAVTRE